MNLVAPIRVPETSRAAARSDFNLQAVTKPILLHLIGRELRYPLIFMLRCRATLGRFKKTIDPRFPAELVEIAAMPIWVYLSLSKRIGKPKAFEITRVALLTGGVAAWSFAYSSVDEPRTFENLCDRELAVNKTGPTRWNTLEVVNRASLRGQSHALPLPRAHDLARCARADAHRLSDRQRRLRTYRTRFSSIAAASAGESPMERASATSSGNTRHGRVKRARLRSSSSRDNCAHLDSRSVVVERKPCVARTPRAASTTRRLRDPHTSPSDPRGPSLAEPRCMDTLRATRVAIVAFVALEVLACDAPKAAPTSEPVAASPPSDGRLANGLIRVEPSTVCMVNNQHMAKAQIPVLVDGKTYFGCCAMCKGKLENDAATRTAMDPVTAKPVDKATAIIARNDEGIVFYFESDETLRRYVP